MRLTVIFFIFVLTNSLISFTHAQPLKGGFSFSNYDQAENSDTQLKFTVVSTKVGLFSSDVDGYVKSFQYTANFDDKNLILRDMEIKFDPKMMDTDGEARDEKLHTLCLEADKYPEVKVLIKGPTFIKDKKDVTYSSTVLIRGKEFEVPVKMKTIYDEQSAQIIVMGTSQWSLKGLQIPDPSIAVATLSDEIDIKFQLIIKTNR
jgi:polyisoprenoid-binding protein YceI